MSYLVVSPLSRLAETAVLHRAASMITLLGEGHAFHRPAVIAKDKHLNLSLNDISIATERLTLPQEAHVASVIAFARAWDRKEPILIHCWMGISRSPAAALIAALAIAPDQDDRALADRLRAASPSATPNAKLIEIADTMLARGGALVAATAAIGRGADAMEGEPFRLDIAAGDHASGVARSAPGGREPHG